MTYSAYGFCSLDCLMQSKNRRGGNQNKGNRRNGGRRNGSNQRSNYGHPNAMRNFK